MAFQDKDLNSSTKPSQQPTKVIPSTQKVENSPCCSKAVLRSFRLALNRWHPKKPDTDPYRGREYKQLCEVYKTVFGKEPEDF